MAQAARLNLRMQKEIKLLLNDPPHGVSLNLSEDESAFSSLSSIEARIEGPDGTVYSKGVFVMKIQIPERYPFQPPNVTFVTPIYHPNIDNGGRICLDILNLPPKGAWQPSLNIATVLRSIGLLLSEPNPDDGLMAEISREYKYNRQVFDINARSWTEKYGNSAAIGASGWSSVDGSILAQNMQMEEIQNLESLPKASNKDCEGSRKKMRLLGQKLSLKSEGTENTTTGKQDLVAIHLSSTARSTNPTACLSDVSSKKNATSENMSVSADSGVVSKKEYQQNGKNLQLLGQRLSATSEAPSKRSAVNVEDKLPNHLPTSTSNTKDSGMQSSDDVLEKSMTKSIDGLSDSLYKVSEGNRTNVRSLGQKMSLKLVKPENESNDQKENMATNRLPALSGFNNLQKGSSDVVSSKSSTGGTNLVQLNSNNKHVLPNTQLIPNKECDQGRKKLCLLSKRLSLKSELPEMNRTNDEGYKPHCSQNDRKPNELPLSAPVPKQSNCSIKQNATPMENIVVSDSEDSADECERPSRSRLSLMRRRLAGKLKS